MGQPDWDAAGDDSEDGLHYRPRLEDHRPYSDRLPTEIDVIDVTPFRFPRIHCYGTQGVHAEEDTRGRKFIREFWCTGDLGYAILPETPAVRETTMPSVMPHGKAGGLAVRWNSLSFIAHRASDLSTWHWSKVPMLD